MPETRVAVDTNFLMNLARPQDTVLDSLDVIRSRVRGAQILITPTTLDELGDKEQRDPDPETRALARRALAGLRTWRVVAAELNDVESIVARNIANELLDQRIIPASERNDALILAEAAMLDCQLLVSGDSDLRDADPARLALVLREAHAPMVVVRRPDEIVRLFTGR